MSSVDIHLRRFPNYGSIPTGENIFSKFPSRVDDEVKFLEEINQGTLLYIGDTWDLTHVVLAGENAEPESAGFLPILGGQLWAQKRTEVAVVLPSESVIAAHEYLRSLDIGTLIESRRHDVENIRGLPLDSGSVDEIHELTELLTRFYAGAAGACDCVVKAIYS
ncbi:DUF1877 family protein [Streptacidiphilus sp. PAMC 29251]